MPFPDLLIRLKTLPEIRGKMNNRSFKILIVDDIPTNIQVLGSVLRKAGYEVAFTDNGQDAINKAKSGDIISAFIISCNIVLLICKCNRHPFFLDTGTFTASVTQVI